MLPRTPPPSPVKMNVEPTDNSVNTGTKPKVTKIPVPVTSVNKQILAHPRAADENEFTSELADNADVGMEHTAKITPSQNIIYGDFVPPSGKLGALTRKENEIFALMDIGSKNKEHLTDLYSQYNERFNVLSRACFAQTLNEAGRKQQDEWWGTKTNDTVYRRIAIMNYIKNLDNCCLPSKPSECSRSVASGYSQSVLSRSSASSVSAKVKLAEKKAKLLSEKAYHEKLSKMEEIKHEEEKRMKKALREAEVEKLEMEHDVLKQELEKIDDLADTLQASPRKFEPLSDVGNDKLCSILDKQVIITEKLAKHQEKAELPKRQIPVFDGTDPTKYKAFMTNFERTIHEKCQDYADSLYYLEQFTAGNAGKLVNSCLSISSKQVAYRKALQLLEEEYGNEFKAANSFLEKLDKWPNVKNEDGAALHELAVFLLTCQNVLENISGLNQLNSPKEIMAVVMKLPYELRKKWRNKTMSLIENHYPVTFSQLVAFVRTEAKILNQPMFGMIKEDTKDNKREKIQKKNFVTKIDAIVDEPSKKIDDKTICYCCKKENHLIDRCFHFKKKNYDEKIELLKKLKLCFCCLKPGHWSKYCNAKLQCEVCKGTHPTVLHKTDSQKNKSDKTEHVNATTLHNKTKRILCAVVPIKIKVEGRPELVETYAALDTCSSSSFIDVKLLKDLGVKGTSSEIILNTMKGKDSSLKTKVVNNLLLHDLDNNRKDCIPVVYAQENWPFCPDDTPKPSDVLEAVHLKNLPFRFINANVGVLIGMDRPEMLKPLEISDGPPHSAYATKHHLGWALNGPVGTTTNSDKFINNRVVVQDKHDLDNKIKQMYLDDYSDNYLSKYEMSVDDNKWHDIMINSVNLIDDKYEIKLPLKENVELPDNNMQAFHSFQSLKKRLAANDDLFKDYCDFMNMMLQRGFMEKVPQQDEQSSFFITHHAVYHKEKNKIRVVFNCSLKYKGTSLNDCLYQGPDMTNNLLGTLLRFRQERTAVTGDIEKMFYMVKVSPGCRKYLRFYWFKNSDLNQEPEVYQLTVHLFGAKSSPSVAGFALKQTVVDNPEFSEVSKNAVNRNFYVDDFLLSCDEESDAVQTLKDVKNLIAKGGFNLTQITTNSEFVLQTLNKGELANDLKQKNLTVDSERVLGLVWDTSEDNLGFKINTRTLTISKRGILSAIHSIYDPLGLSGPAIIPAKKIFQRSCEYNVGWDEKLPVELEEQWLQWYSNLHLLKDYRIKRCVKPENCKTTELHFFSDGSEVAYGAVVYVRYVSDAGEITCSPLLAKARLTPLGNKALKTVPRIELNGAKLSVLLQEILEEELDITVDRKYFWSDSKTVLKYISNEDKRFVRFVANRVSYIRSHTQVSQWNFIPSEQNPADSISRGVSIQTFLELKCWKLGPEFLSKPDDQWPRIKIEPDDEELEVVKNKCLVSSLKPEELSPTDVLLQSTSSWYGLKRKVAWFLRLKAILLKKSSQNGKLTLKEINHSELSIIKFIQAKHYNNILSDIASNKLSRKNNLVKLDPFIDNDGVMRVGGRLDNSILSYDVKHPIILPARESCVTNLVRESHKMLGHMGRESITAYIRRKFWIVSLSSVIRKLMFNCVICRRLNSQPSNQKMSTLPEDRVTAGEPAFSRIGLDFFGPFESINGRKREKRYGVIFTCLNTRAAHIEMATSLNTDSFINAFRRFIARRGNVHTVRSDNGTNLKSGCKELKQEIEKWNHNTISNWMLQRSIDWKFQPPSASHFGGVFEREIRSIRKVLSAILKEQPMKLSDDSLNTLFCEIESILNCRPITKLSEDVTDPEALTPNHLLLLHSGATFPPGLFSKDDCTATKHWKRVQYLANLFWSRWKKEYLPLLHERQKWWHSGYTYKVGDLVIVTDQQLPRNQWPLARVIETFPSDTGEVRVVKLKVARSNTPTELIRPISKIILLSTISEDK